MVRKPSSKGLTAPISRKLRSDLQHQQYGLATHDDHPYTSHEGELPRRSNHQPFFRSSLSSSIIIRQTPQSRVISYSVGKTAFDALTFEYAKAESTIVFHAASPCHSKTAFDGFRRTKDPLDGRQ